MSNEYFRYYSAHRGEDSGLSAAAYLVRVPAIPMLAFGENTNKYTAVAGPSAIIVQAENKRNPIPECRASSNPT